MDFLSGMLGSAAGGLGNALTSALFGPQDRISHERFIENEARGDIHYEREAARQGDFLKNLAPSQGEAYNTYQDTTYSRDTERQTERIQNMAGKLGMSPWEITGAGGANPLPSPGPSQANTGAASAFLSQMIPLKLAKIQQETALATTKMQTDAQLQSSGVNIKKNSQQEAQKLLTQAAERLTTTQEANARTQIVLDTINQLQTLMPRTTATVNAPGAMGSATETYLPGWKDLLKYLTGEPQYDAQGRRSAGNKIVDLTDVVKKLPQAKIDTVANMLIDMANSAGHTAQNVGKGINDFLKGLTN